MLFWDYFEDAPYREAEKVHTLTQAIARANRVYPGKDVGLIVNYNTSGPRSDLAVCLDGSSFLPSVHTMQRPPTMPVPFGAVNSRVNFDSHSTPITRFRGLLKALLSCHSCLVINYIAINGALITQRSVVQIHPPQPILPTSYKLPSAFSSQAMFPSHVILARNLPSLRKWLRLFGTRNLAVCPAQSWLPGSAIWANTSRKARSGKAPTLCKGMAEHLRDKIFQSPCHSARATL